jgi:hypothetical protein
MTRRFLAGLYDARTRRKMIRIERDPVHPWVRRQMSADACGVNLAAKRVRHGDGPCDCTEKEE